MITAGVDIGSATTKAVVLKDDQSFSSAIRPTGIDIPEAAQNVLGDALAKIKLSFADIEQIVSTGYGRASVPFPTKKITEITCNAAGVNHLYPQARLIVDIGGQDSKVIKLNSHGGVLQFAMNDKCAAGTGKFLEVAAQSLGTSIEELGKLAAQSQKRIIMSNTCTVFAQSEIVSLIAQKADKRDIAAALNESVVSRVYGLINSVNPDAKAVMVMTGGVAKDISVVNIMGRMMGREIIVPQDPQIVTALGAALLARN